MDEAHLKKNRHEMVKKQLAGRDIYDKRVLAVMRDLPRHLFVPEMYWDEAYADHPLPIGENQTISQPYIVALMTQSMALEGDETVLEVGCGSGYQAVVLAALVKKVYSIERYTPLAEKATQTIKELAISNVEIIVADGSLGLEEYAPYDGIMVTAAAPSVPQILLAQLSHTGRMVIPVGRRWEQYLQVWRREEGSFVHSNLCAVSFVPLRGKEGWKEEEWRGG